MGRTVTNAETISYAREASLGVLPGSPVWNELEPNTINSFGTTIAKTERNPITRDRTRRKSIVTDLDSAVQFEADLTLSHMKDFAEGFCYAKARGADVFIPSAATATAFTIPALTADQAGRLLYGAASATSLVYARGFANLANNGMFPLSAASAPGGNSLTVGGLTAETIGSNVFAEVAVCGIRGAGGDLKIDAQGNLISTALDFTTLGIIKGQTIHVGGIDLTHQFFNPANIGFARVMAVTAHKLTLAKKDQPFVLDDGTSTGSGGTPVRVDLLFGQFVRNVPVGSADYQELSFQFELASPNLMSDGSTGYEYALGNYCNQLQTSMPLSNKATMTPSFVGQDTLVPSATRALGAAGFIPAGETEGFSTATDIARLRLQDVDETGLTTDFKSATFTLNNQVSGEKVLGNLGPKFLNLGQLQVQIEAELLFSNPDVIERIRCNKTVGLDWVLYNDDGGVAFDLPTGTLEGGTRNFPANQSVTLTSTFQAYQDDAYGYTIGISFFPVLPVVPCD